MYVSLEIKKYSPALYCERTNDEDRAAQFDRMCGLGSYG